VRLDLVRPVQFQLAGVNFERLLDLGLIQLVVLWRVAF